MKQHVRTIDWRSDSTDTVVRKIHAAEGQPGVLDVVDGRQFHLFDVHREEVLRGRPGEIVAQRAGAICRATVDGAVWITQLKWREVPGRPSLKLPATRALELAGVVLDVPEAGAPVHVPASSGATYRDISYEESAGVGYLRFNFYNGAMSTEQCHRLQQAYRYARSRRRTRVIVLMGGTDFFSNGIHLNVIEAAEDPAVESWRNLQAINDVVRDVVETESHLVISALSGDAAAGGVPFAAAADRVVAREDVVLNPYYRHMGGLYGSEYWTYLLPRRVGAERAAELTDEPFTPIGTGRAVGLGLLDAAFGSTVADFHSELRRMAERLAAHAELGRWLEEKRRRRERDEQVKPLEAYRADELSLSYECFFGADRSYHEARHRFAFKLGTEAAMVEKVA
jgi:putative two-component system hydrogenase maturation factor HypX/HoxX